MKRRILVVLAVLCVLLLTAGFVPAQDQARQKNPLLDKGTGEYLPPQYSGDPINPRLDRMLPGAKQARNQSGLHHPPQLKGPVGPADAVVITTQFGYKAKLWSYGLYYPAGIGVSQRGDSIYYDDDYGGYVYRDRNHSVTAIPVAPTYLHAMRLRGALYVGTGYGDIYKLDPAMGVTFAGYDIYGDDVAGLDVDTETGVVYFVTNYFDSSYEWTGLYKLPPNTTEAILLAWWYDEPAWGLAVRGSYIYVSDYYYNEVWRTDKNATGWQLYAWDLWGPTDICFDSAGNLVVAEWDSGSVAVIKARTGQVGRIAYGFYSPYYLQLDKSDAIYLTDFDAGEIWRLWK
jgi:DNA-binding beta-propeller fold protein YncE